jgi:hypothetical protein
VAAIGVCVPKISWLMSTVIKRHRHQKGHRSTALSRRSLHQTVKNNLNLLPLENKSNTLNDLFR